MEKIFAVNIDNKNKPNNSKDILEGYCISPFKYKKQNITDCVDSGRGKWCATEVKKTGTYSKFGYCPETQEQINRSEKIKKNITKKPSSSKKDSPISVKGDYIKSVSPKTDKKSLHPVNCKVGYIRPEYDNLKEWTEDPNNIYIGRKGVVFISNKETGKKERFPKEDSEFCNPFKIGKQGDREEVLNKYEEYIRKKIENNNELKKKLINMRGKNLGCWCYPEKCHGDILLKIIEELYTSETSLSPKKHQKPPPPPPKKTHKKPPPPPKKTHKKSSSSPAYQPESPAYQPESPAYQPESPAYQPESPAYQPESPAYQPESPTYQPESPAYQPESPAYQPDSPAYQPELSYGKTIKLKPKIIELLRKNKKKRNK